MVSRLTQEERDPVGQPADPGGDPVGSQRTQVHLKTSVKMELVMPMVVSIVKFIMCAQNLEELSVASCRLENEVKSIRRAACVTSGEVLYPPQHQLVTRQPQQQQQVQSESPAKVYSRTIHITLGCGDGIWDKSMRFIL